MVDLKTPFGVTLFKKPFAQGYFPVPQPQGSGGFPVVVPERPGSGLTYEQRQRILEAARVALERARVGAGKPQQPATNWGPGGVRYVPPTIPQPVTETPESAKMPFGGWQYPHPQPPGYVSPETVQRLGTALGAGETGRVAAANARGGMVDTQEALHPFSVAPVSAFVPTVGTAAVPSAPKMVTFPSNATTVKYTAPAAPVALTAAQLAEADRLAAMTAASQAQHLAGMKSGAGLLRYSH